ncbi:MAG: succinate dehydrogenase/fumarate reductase iron-sulfur subunit [SAR324 cluster bacterium]|nr:succinate dehydrogenase/fumarate reductase iron-sulfur subunit [SAR324 cluster bacterium]MCZ6557685.1 succinate dehydrogenase/fumarate reductase iron-sulfur subunit [SAR324 cluster bacterium]MCZ6730494.1 succinate dehydrogenase/fumarate reductase iron-sulfur subunit [SAR324 cluster bacterium]
MSEETITLNVTRFRPGQDSEPVLQSYTIPYRKDWVVLDALNHIKDWVDQTLSYRWSCRMGVCGSCGMMVNGEPKLTCSAFLREYYPNPVTVEPLVNFPVMRDLVVDMSDFMDKLKSVKPWLIREEEKPVSEGEYLQSPAQLDVYKQFSLCINCMLCYAACPVYGLEPDFIGPAALALAHRYNEDSRDQGKEQRREVIASNEGTWDCTFVGECSVVCPKHVDPAAAIQRLKVDNTKSWIKSLLLPKGGRA